MAYKHPDGYRKWYESNRQKADSYAKEWRAKERQRLIDEFGGKCIECGYNDPICLDFDHIHNDGNTDSKKNIIFHVKDNPARFQLLCKNCNWKKEYRRRIDAKRIKETGKDDASGRTQSGICQEDGDSH